MIDRKNSYDEWDDDNRMDTYHAIARDIARDDYDPELEDVSELYWDALEVADFADDMNIAAYLLANRRS